MSTKIAAPALHPIEVCRQHKLVPVIAIKDADSAAGLDPNQLVMHRVAAGSDDPDAGQDLAVLVMERHEAGLL